jgi:hypothetical protein
MSIVIEPFSISRNAAMSCGVITVAAKGTNCGASTAGATCGFSSGFTLPGPLILLSVSDF